MKNTVSTAALHWLLQMAPDSSWSTGSGAQRMEGRQEGAQGDVL